MGAEEAQKRIERILGRPAQDSLEAAIVLETFEGLPARLALEVAEASAQLPSETDPPAFVKATTVRTALAGQGLALAAALMATVTWAVPLARAFGPDYGRRAWDIALPLSLGTQWLVRRRFHGGLAGFAGRSRVWWSVLASVTLGIGLASLGGSVAALAGALAFAWLSILVVGQRGWGILYAGILVAMGTAMRLNLSAPADLVLLYAVPTIMLAAAVGTRPPPTRLAGPWRVAVPAGLAGAVVGIFITLAGANPRGLRPDLALLTFMPTLLGTLWGSQHLARLWELSVEPLHLQMPDAGTLPARHFARRIVLGALARLAAATIGLGALVVLLLVMAAKHESAQAVAVLLAAASVMAIVSLVVVMLEAFGRQVWALITASLTAAPLVLRSLGILTLGSRGEVVLAATLIGAAASFWSIRWLLKDPHRSLIVATL